MIVVDTNIIVALELSIDISENVHHLVERDSDWRIPGLWRHEFSNVLRKMYKLGEIGHAEALDVLGSALERYAPAETDMSDISALTLAMESGLTAYDAYYLALARQLGVVLVTEDAELIRKSSGRAMSTTQWLAAAG